MSVLGPRTDEELSDKRFVTLTGGVRPSSDDLILAPDDLSPNRNWREIDEDGMPRAWGVDLPPASVGDFVYVSDPGATDAAPNTPPRRDTLSRQTPLSVPNGDSHTQFSALLGGWQPGGATSRLPRQGKPLVETVDLARKGFEAGPYGISIDFRKTKHRDRTPPSALSPLTIAAGEGIGLYVPPEVFGTGARYMGVYVTRPGSGGLAGTEREQAVADLVKHPPGTIFKFYGPYDDNGRRPATRDQSGRGRLPEPLVNRFRSGRVSVIKKSARFDLAVGDYIFGYQAYPRSGGATPISRLTAKVRVNGDTVKDRRKLDKNEDPKAGETLEVAPDGTRYAVSTRTLRVQRNTAFWFYWKDMPNGWGFVPWVLWQPLTSGSPVWYRVYRGRTLSAEEMAFEEERARRGIPFYGYAPDAEPGGLRWRAMGALPVTEDTTGLPLPDDTTGPDVMAVGPGAPTSPATYFLATTREDEFGGESSISPATRHRLTATNTTFRVSPDPTTNELRNPAGAERTSDGATYDWTGLTARTASPAAYFEDGLLILDRTGAGASAVPLSAAIDIPGEEASVTVRARLRVGRFTGGTDPTQFLARFLNSDGGIVSDVELLRMSGLGEISLGEEGWTFGPEADADAAKPAGASSVQVLARGGTGTVAGTNWNSTAYVSDMGVVFQPAALRRFERLGSEEPADFDPPAGITYPHSSAAACGPAATSQDAGASPEPLIREVTFEGATDFPAEWTTIGGSNLVAGFTAAVKTPPAWAAGVAKAVGNQIVEAGRVFTAQDAGTTGTTKPNFASVGRGGTILDSTGTADSITWKETADALFGASWHEIADTTNNVARQHLRMLTLAADEIESAATWQANTPYAVGDRMRPPVTNGHYYRATVAGTSGASEPAYTTNGTTFRDGTVTWRDEGVAQGRSLYFRFFDANPQLPQKAELLRGRIADAANKALASIYYTPTGVRAYTHDANGSRVSYVTAMSGLSSGTPVDLELGITGGGTSKGAITVSGSKNYNTRVSLGGFQNRAFGSRFPRRIHVGYLETDPGIKATIRHDNILISRTGAPLDYEHPAAASGTTVPAFASAPDAPPAEPTPPAWAAKTVYASGAKVVPTTPNNHRYAAQNAGRSGPNQPSWPLTGTVRDNAGLVAVARSSAYAVGNSVLKPGGTGADAEWYEVTTAGTTAGTAPAYPTTDGATVTDGTAVLTTRKTVVWAESTLYRLFDVNENALNQLWWYTEPGVPKADRQEYGAYCKTPITVVPGEVVTQAVPGRFRLFETPEDPSHQFFVTLYGPDVSPIEVGSPFGPGRDSALVSRTGGTRSDSASGMPLLAAHAHEDFWQAFTVPAGYHWATITPHNGVGGVYLFQEHLFHAAAAAVTTQAARDALRAYGRATSGSAAIVIDASGASNPYRWPLYAGRISMGVRVSDLQEGATVTNIRYRGGSSRTGPFSVHQTDPFFVPESAYYEVSFDMAGQTGEDGATPVVGSGSVSVVMRPFMTTLLKEDGSELPGGTFVNGHDSADDRPETEALVLDGDIVAPARSKPVQKLTRPLTVHIATEEAKRYVESLTEGDEVVIANPFLAGTGRRQTLRIGTRPVVDTSLPTARANATGRDVYGTFEIPAGAQVLEEAPLEAP